MSARDTLEQVKSDLQAVNAQIDAAQTDLAALKAKRQQLVADRNDLQAFLDWKAAQP